jgi:hypothetical protein
VTHSWTLPALELALWLAVRLVNRETTTANGTRPVEQPTPATPRRSQATEKHPAGAALRARSSDSDSAPNPRGPPSGRTQQKQQDGQLRKTALPGRDGTGRVERSRSTRALSVLTHHRWKETRGMYTPDPICRHCLQPRHPDLMATADECEDCRALTTQHTNPGPGRQAVRLALAGYRSNHSRRKDHAS